MLARRFSRVEVARCFLAVLSIAIVFWSAGCATNRSSMDIKLTCPGNPSEGPAIVIRSIQDLRTFEAKPTEPSTPSLKNVADLEKPEIRARAIARKRNGWGKALGDIVLPEGRTVSDLTREVVVTAFQRAGYRVVESGQAGAEAASPIDVGILELWTWMTPGMWTVSNEFRGRLSIRGPSGSFAQVSDAEGYGVIRSPVSGFGTWQGAIYQGLEKLIADAVVKLPPAAKP